jgi:hypothetical protein
MISTRLNCLKFYTRTNRLLNVKPRAFDLSSGSRVFDRFLRHILQPLMTPKLSQGQ